ncbi:MAG TPA: FtsH protease activity modulator HflK [Candidatus Ornithospirochaeta avicola]|uniref:Protein HflK n=1 Tax=Candidatus Ornithospirochaeta avicola TaxID=2840896 RepID=A0A9D1PRJ3_9SPIO|nr:FtsH protease activity modulator HflK [Candidatus Ornithospirochaeta avicola]
MDENKKRNFSFLVTPRFVVLAIIVIAVLLALATSFFSVDQTENAIVLRLGKYSRTVGAGLNFKLPFGIEKNYNVKTNVVQTMTFGYTATDTSGTSLSGSYENTDESLMLTGDLNIVSVEWIIQYIIDDPYAWLFNVNEKEKTIRDISQSVMNQIVGDLPILSVMTNLRTQIEVDAQQKMQEIFDKYDFGIRIVTVKLQNIVPPEGDVQDAFEDVNKAIQDMNRLINEGKEYYNQQIPEAQGEAEKIIQQAHGYASERVNQANGDTARFLSVLSEYENSRETTAVRLYIETMEEVLESNKDITIIDEDLSSFIPFKNLGGSV